MLIASFDLYDFREDLRFRRLGPVAFHPDQPDVGSMLFAAVWFTALLFMGFHDICASFFLHLSSSLAGRVTVVHTAHIRDRLGWCGVVLDVRLFFSVQGSLVSVVSVLLVSTLLNSVLELLGFRKRG